MKVVNSGSLKEQMKNVLNKFQMLSQNIVGNAIVIELLTISEKETFVDTLVNFAKYFMSFGKGMWSLAAVSQNQCYDLLSLNTTAFTIENGKISLSKVQLEKEQLMKRVFGFSSQKQKDLKSHQILAKLQLPFNNIVFFIVRNAKDKNEASTQKIIQQEMRIEQVIHKCTLSILRPDEKVFDQEEKIFSFLKKSGIKIKKEEELSKNQREIYLKLVIEKLQGQLNGKQEELNIYRSKSEIPEQQFGIPSERILMGQDRYSHLNRRIKQTKIL